MPNPVGRLRSRLGAGDASGRKGTLRRSKTEPDLQYQAVTRYVSDRIIEQGWERSDADPIVSKQVKAYHRITGQERRSGDVHKVESRYASTVASMAVNMMLGTPLVELKGVLSGKAFRTLRASTFRCIANAILIIFDEEDFERIEDSKFPDEYEKFASSIDQSLDVTKQNLNLDEFDTLRESDAFCILKRYEDGEGRNSFQGQPWDYNVTLPACVNKSDVDMAREVIQSFVPLKRSDRVQLALELMFKTCYHVYDTLALGVLAGITIDSSCTADSIRSTTDESPSYESEAAGTLASFMVDVVRGLSWLVEVKSSALEIFQGAITSHMSSGGYFWPFDEEVIEVIKFAEFERRVSGYRLINIVHVLLGLSLSRVGKWVKRLLDLQREKGLLLPQISELSILSLFRKSRALVVGSGPLTLAHVVWAIFPRQPARQGEVKEKDEGSYAKVLDDGEWDAKLMQWLGLDGCDTLEDVKMWNYFSNSSEEPLDLCSHNLVIKPLMLKEKYTIYIPIQYR